MLFDPESDLQVRRTASALHKQADKLAAKTALEAANKRADADNAEQAANPLHLRSQEEFAGHGHAKRVLRKKSQDTK